MHWLPRVPMRKQVVAIKCILSSKNVSTIAEDLDLREGTVQDISARVIQRVA